MRVELVYVPGQEQPFEARHGGTTARGATPCEALERLGKILLERERSTADRRAARKAR